MVEAEEAIIVEVVVTLLGSYNEISTSLSFKGMAVFIFWISKVHLP